jgi:DNA-binding NarL/FixJ family response regulator
MSQTGVGSGQSATVYHVAAQHSAALEDAVESDQAMRIASAEVKRHKAERDNAILRAADDGIGPTEIGRRLGLSPSTAKLIIREARLRRGD